MAPRNTRVNPEVETRSPARSFAQTLDNFYAPARDRRSEQAFQRGLQGFGSILSEKADRIKAEQREDEYNQGVADAHREAAGQELKGVKTGSIFRQNSSYYEAGLNEQKGKAAALKWKNDVATAYQNWEGRFSNDPEAFRAWMNEQSGRFIQSIQDNPHMLTTALPVVSEVSNNLAMQHTNFTNERLQTEQFDAFNEVVGGLFNGLGTEYDEDTLIEALQEETDQLYEMEGGIANDKLVEAAIMWSDANDNIDGIAVLAKAHRDGKIKLSMPNQLKLERATDQLEAEIERQINSRDREAADQAKAVKQAAVTDYVDRLIAGENIDPRDYYRAGDFRDEDIFRALVTAQNSFQSAESNSGLSEGEQRFNYESAKIQAGADFDERLRLIRQHAGLGNSFVKQEMEALKDLKDGNAYYTDQGLKELRKQYLSGIGTVEEGSGISFENVGEARVFAEGQYMRRMTKRLRGADPSEYDTIHDEVVDEVNDLLIREYPVMMENSINSDGGYNPNAVASGLAESVQDRQQQAIEEERAAAVQAGALQAIEESEQEAEAREQELITSTDPEVIENQPDDFYENILQRFTDGEYTAQDVSPSVLVETASRVLGANENDQNALIREFLADGGVDLDPAVTAWCAAFVNSVLAQNGIDGTKSNLARSFLDWGEKTETPAEGDIVVLSRGRRDGWKGHVGLFQGFDENGDILMLGGNQSDRVSIKAYPKERLLGYRTQPGSSGTADTIQAIAENSPVKGKLAKPKKPQQEPQTIGERRRSNR